MLTTKNVTKPGSTMRFIVLTGTSGAGKITASNYFGDIGYYAVDNIPPRLLAELAASCRDRGCDRVLAVVDSRVGKDELKGMPDALRALTVQGTPAEILFLDASDDVLVRRFKETRRPHPIFQDGRGSILDAITTERQMLDEMRARADKIFDTSNLSATELAKSLADAIGESVRSRLIVTVQSFGFKHGLPIDADLVFDVRFLVNPHYVPDLKPLTGQDEKVHYFIHQDPLTEPFLKRMFDLISFSLPQYEREGKAYLTIAIGCTGGQHRSVAIAEDTAQFIRGEGYRVTVFHRDAERNRALLA